MVNEEKLKSLLKIGGRLSYLEPNEIPSKYFNWSTNDNSEQQVGTDNLIFRNEDLTMFVDLKVIIPDMDIVFKSQTENGAYYNVWGGDGDDGNNAKETSLFKGTNIKLLDNSEYNVLTTNYTEASYTELRKEYNKKNSKNSTFEKGRETLCIRSISVKYSQNFYPQVTIEFVDVRGFALMMPTDRAHEENEIANRAGFEGNATYSVFRSFFRLPVPRYLLTLKGYFGKPITYSLALENFKSKFDNNSGDFIITCKFIGYMYGIFADLPFNFLIAAPFIGTISDAIIKGQQQDGKTYVSDIYNIIWQGFEGDGKLISADKSETGEINSFMEFLKRVVTFNDAAKDTNFSYKYTNEKYSQYSALVAKIKSIQLKIEDLKTKLYPKQKACFSTDPESLLFTFNKFKDNQDVGKDSKIGDALKKEFDDFYDRYFKGDKDNYGLITTILTDAQLSNIFVDGSYLSSRNYLEILINGLKNFKKEISNLPSRCTLLTVNGKVFTIGNNYNDKFNFDDQGVSEDKVYTTDVCGIEIKMHCIDKILNLMLDSANEYMKDFNSKLRAYTNASLNRMIGFLPSVRNFYRMFFAHMSCFMNVFHNTLLQITAQKKERTVRALIGDFTETDRKVSSPDDVVAPFPLSFKMVDKKKTLVYPGLDSRLKNIPEVKLVDDIYYSVRFCQNIVNMVNLLPSSKRVQDYKKTLAENAQAIIEAEDAQTKQIVEALENTSISFTNENPAIPTVIQTVSSPSSSNDNTNESYGGGGGAGEIWCDGFSTGSYLGSWAGSPNDDVQLAARYFCTLIILTAYSFGSKNSKATCRGGTRNTVAFQSPTRYKDINGKINKIYAAVNNKSADVIKGATSIINTWGGKIPINYSGSQPVYFQTGASKTDGENNVFYELMFGTGLDFFGSFSNGLVHKSETAWTPLTVSFTGTSGAYEYAQFNGLQSDSKLKTLHPSDITSAYNSKKDFTSLKGNYDLFFGTLEVTSFFYRTDSKSNTIILDQFEGSDKCVSLLENSMKQCFIGKPSFNSLYNFVFVNSDNFFIKSFKIYTNKIGDAIKAWLSGGNDFPSKELAFIKTISSYN